MAFSSLFIAPIHPSNIISCSGDTVVMLVLGAVTDVVIAVVGGAHKILHFA